MKKPSNNPSEHAPSASGRFLSAIDIITLVYTGWISLYMAIGFSRATNPEIHLPIYISIITAVLLLAYMHRAANPKTMPQLHKVLSFVRGVYPVMLFGYFFISLQSVTRIVFGTWLDPFFLGLDHSIFGYYPSLEWGLRYDGFWISELFHFAYFCYYPMIAGLPVYFYFKNKEAFKETIFSLCFVFYLCYFIYSLLPVIGGRYFPEAMELTKLYRGGPFTHVMAFIYNKSTHLGGAFPSSHVAVAIVLSISALRNLRPVGYVFAIISFFLALATVYCHYHWFVDMVAGVFTAIGGYYLALWVHRKLEEKSP